MAGFFEQLTALKLNLFYNGKGFTWRPKLLQWSGIQDSLLRLNQIVVEGNLVVVSSILTEKG